MNILDFTKYLSNYDIIKYVLSISFVWIFFNFTLQNQIFNLNFIVRTVIIIGICYIIKYRFKKKNYLRIIYKKFKLLRSIPYK